MADELGTVLSTDVLDAARQVLGWRLRTSFDGAMTEVTVTEVEAYGGLEDPASHAYRGPTKRNGSLFAPAGTLYVYLSYGIHWCMNVVVDGAGTPNAVLLRGGVPVAGADVMERRRGRNDHLADGPDKLAQALGVTGEQDGTDLTDGPVRLIPDERPRDGQVVATPRIGISKAAEWPWRFVLQSPTLL